jgi:hypothetical protein
MSKKFAAQVDENIRESEERLQAVLQASVSDLIDYVQTPVGKGGRMRVRTGFLRASGRAGLDGMPSGPTRGEKEEPNSYDSAEKYSGDNSVILTLLNFTVGRTFYFGWTANYARYREVYDGFLEAGAQRWQQIVDANVAKVRDLIK